MSALVIRRWSVIAAAAVMAALLLMVSPAAGQILPPLHPAATPTPTPTQTQSATATPTPIPSADAAAAAAENPDAEPAATDEQAPKSEVVTNPGDVAFTDYQPFSLNEIEPEPFQSKWKTFVAGLRGLGRYSLFHDAVRFRIGGKGQFDGTTGVGSDKYEEYNPPIESQFDVRRLEVFAAGRIREFNFNLTFQLGPDWGLNNAWIEGAKGGLEVWGHFLGKLRLGYMQEPFSLGRQTSSYNLGFLERSLPVQTVAPGSNAGMMIHNAAKNGRSTWAAGIFSFGRQTESNASGSLLSLTGRVTLLPLYRDEGRKLIHVGASLSSRSPQGGDTQYRSRPEARFVSFLADTGKIDASHITLWGIEAAAVHGPWWMAAEIIRSEVSAQLVDNPTFGGSYVQVGWFVTGESRPYRTNSGIFDRVRPTKKYKGGNPFKKKNGGAWEVAGRVSSIDLTDGLVEGGDLTDYSASLSWYPNATTRIELNYILASPKNRGTANIFLLRLQFQPW
jgi:phosphate-selective porin